MTNSNQVAEPEINSFRGPISECKNCLTISKPMKQIGTCRFCLGHGYLAQCLNCDGVGLVGGGDVWSGQKRSDFKSTCNICGGLGSLPSRKPMKDIKTEEVTQAQAQTGSAPTPVTP